MIFNEIKCHVKTSLSLVGGMHPLHPPCVRAWAHYGIDIFWWTCPLLAMLMVVV